MNQHRQELNGNFILPFAIMLGLVLALQPAALLHECTQAFRPEILQRFLPDHQLMSTLLDPLDFGFPVRRLRSYSALVHKRFELVIGVDQLRRLFTPTRLHCGIFFQASNEEAAALQDTIQSFKVQMPVSDFQISEFQLNSIGGIRGLGL